MSTALNYELLGRNHKVFFSKGRGDGLTLHLVEREDGWVVPFALVTLSGLGPCAPDEAFVKDYSENMGMGDWLVKNGIAEPTGVSVQSGYVTINQYRFDMHKVREHSL